MASYEELKNRVANGEKPTSQTEKGKSTYEELKERVRKERFEKDVQNVDSSYINLFSDAANRFLGSAVEDYDKVGWSDASSTYQIKRDNWQDLDYRRSVIESWMEANKDNLDEDSYRNLSGSLNAFKTDSQSVVDAFSSAMDYYSQWDTEEDYLAYKDYEDKSKFDVEAGQREIEALESVLEESRRTSRWMTDEKGSARAEAIRQKYGDAEDIETLLNEKKTYLSQAKRIQEGITLASAMENEDFDQYSGYVSTKTDGRWAKLTSQFSMGYDDLTYEYINGDENGVRQEIINKAISYDADTDEFFVYDYMTEDQIAIYNYYYAKEGKDAAEKYLDSIRETLNYQAASERYEKMEGKTALELLFGVEAGADQFQSGVQGAWQAITGEKDYIPLSENQILSGMVREDLIDVGPTLPKWLGDVTLGQAGYDAITTTSNMAPSIFTSIVMNAIAPGSGAVVGTAMMGTSAGGNAYQEALNLGYDKSQARAYAVLVGGSEAGLQYLLGGIGKLGGKISNNVVSKMLSGVDNAIFRVAGKLAGNAISEGMEEGIQEILTPWFKNMTLNMNEDVNWSEVAYSSLLGAFTAGIMEGGSIVSGEVNNYQTGKQLYDAGYASRLAEVGKTFAADTVAYQLAGRVNENTGAYTIGRLFNEIGASMTEQNISDIQSNLVKKGMHPSDAKKLAEAVAAVVVNPEAVSKKQAGVLNANDVLAMAVIEEIVEPNSTYYQRNQGYNEALMALAQEKTAPRKSTSSKPAKAAEESTAEADEDFWSELDGGLYYETDEDAELLEGEFEPAAPVSLDGEYTAEEIELLGIASPTKKNTDSETRNEVTDGDGTIPKKSDGATERGSIREITSIKNGQLTMKLEDGREVSSSEVEYGSPAEALVYETVAKMENMNPAVANALVKGYDPASGISAEVYAKGIEEAYTYGYFNYSMQHMMTRGSFGKLLTPTQRNRVYNLGKMARQSDVSKNTQTAKSTTVAKNATTANETGVFFQDDKGNVVGYDAANIKTDAKREAGVQTAQVLKQLGLGGRFVFFESHQNAQGKWVYTDQNGNEVSAPNGMYYKDGTIYIDLNAGKGGAGLTLFTLSHELTHFIEQWSPDKYKVLADFLIHEYEKRGVSMDALVRAKQAKIVELRGEEISYNEAFHEVVADSMEKMFADGNLIQKLQKLKAQDESLFNKIKRFVDKLAKKIRWYYSRLDPDSTEGEFVGRMKDSISDIQDKFAEALMEASENYQSSLTPGEDGIIVNQNGEPVAHATSDGTIQLSMRTYEEDGRKAFRAYLQKCVSSNKLTEAEMDEMLKGIEEIYGICKDFKDKYAPFSSWSDAAVVRDTYGKPVFSVVTPNGDYKMNLDFSLVCKKRRTLDAVFNEMSKRGIIDDFELGQKSVVKINEIIRKYGLETACALCFVDAKRFRQASMADQFTRLYNELVLSLVPEDQRGSIDHFNFSGYETIKKVEGGIDTWPASKLDFSHLDEVMKNYGKGTVEYKAAKYIKTHAEGRRLLLRGDFMSSKGFDAVKTQNKDILKLYNSKKGTGGPKAAFGDVQYMNEIIKKARTWTPAKAYSVGGVRIQSFSDYVPRMVFDYTQMIYDLAATKLPAHAYTKEALFVKQFGLTGVKINMSLIPAITEGGIAPGLDAKGNYVWAGESFDYDTAKEIQNAEGYTENCGTICVGVSHDHILKLLRDPNIRMVIPYHKSGLNPIVAHMNKIAQFHDYTNDQRTKGKDGKALAKDFDFSKALHDMGENASPKAVADQYLKWCVANGYTPRFAEFAEEGNYYKLLEDFTLYDKDGNYVPQREVRAVFPTEGSAFGSMKNLIQAGLEEDAVIEGKRDKKLSAIVDEIQKTLPKSEAEIAETQVEQADRDLEAEVKYSLREIVGPSGKNYGTGVYLDSTLLSDLSEDERVEMVKEFVKELGGSVFTAYDSNHNAVDIHIVESGKKFRNKSGKRVPVTKDLTSYLKFEVKQESIVLVDELILASTYKGTEPATHPHDWVDNDGNNDWDVWTTFFQDKKSTVWEAKLRIANSTNGEKILYDIYPIKMVEGAGTSATTTTTEMVTQPDPNVNMFSDRDMDSVSNRSLLANAFEGVAQNDSERQKIQEYKGKISLINAEEQKLRKLNEQIKELSFTKGPRDTKKISDLQFEAKQTANRISTYDKQLLRLEASKPLQDVLQREKKMAYQRAEKKGKEALEKHRERTAKTQREIIERYQESRKKATESREKTAMRHKIQNVVKELNDLLLNESKKRHVPESMKKAVAEALALVNMDTVGAGERAAKYAALIANETDQDKIDAYTATMENILRQGEKMGQRLKELRDAYEEISESDDPDIANAYDPVIAGCLKELSQSIGNTSLRNMTIEQLSDVYDMYKMVLTRVRDANKSFLDEKKENISALASRVVGEVRRVGGEHTYRAAVLDPVRKFLWNNLKPVYAFEYLGSATLRDAFNSVRAGEDVWAKDVTEARTYYLDKSRKYGYDSWDFKKKYRFESDSGIEFELTLEQILSLYAYSKREQAHDHLRLGGFVFDSNIETYKDKGSKLIKYKVNTADAHQITPDILADIIGKLSKEQMAFVDEMQDYLSTTMGAKGNDVTKKMYGVKLFKEKFYFPLKSAKQFMFEQNEVSGEVKIKNSGFTNKTVAKANNPVILSNFMDVWSGHVNDMSMYHAFVLPLEDFNRIFNFNSPKKEGQPSVSVKGTIQSAYSPAAVSYVKNLITDLNGGARTDSTTGIINKMMGLFKKGSVFASLSVVIQQPSAIARAAALVDTKYFVGAKVDSKRHKLLWEELKQYAPVAIIKEMGYFDTNMGKSTQDFILGKEYSGIKEKMKALVTDSGYRDEILSKAPALADEMAWCSIWDAVKRETRAKNPGMDIKSEAFLQEAGRRFTEVITKTQVYDSVLSRSANMRSKDTGMKMATAFMAEPTTSINMIADALLQGKRGNRKYARAAIGAVIASQIFNSILVSFVYAARDDDEDKTYWEKYLGSLTGKALDSLNPLTYIPFIKDIVSIFQGYDVERSDMAIISDLWNAWQKLGSGNLSVYRKVENFAGSIAQIFGLPVKNIMRDVRGIYQTIESFVSGQQTTKAGIGYAVKAALPAWMGGGDVSNQNQLYEAYLSGDQTQIARVEGRYKDQSAINSAIRMALRENDPRIRQAAEAKVGGDLDEYLRIAKEIIGEKHFSQDNVVAAINAEINALNKGENTSSGTQKVSGMFKADDFATAISQGDQAMANAIKSDIIQTAQRNGKTASEAEKSFNSSASSSCKELFMEGQISESKAVNALVTYCGFEREDAEKRVGEWAFEDEYGFAYSDRGDAYKSGAISAYELKNILMDVGGKTEEEAELQVQVYDWEKEVPGCDDITMSAIQDYNDYCEPAGISKSLYYEAWSAYKDTDGDYDENGDSIPYSKVRKVMPYIDSLDLTAEQKTALAMCWWAESTVRKYKTW